MNIKQWKTNLKIKFHAEEKNRNMEFTLYKNLKKHPITFKIVKYWVKLKFPVPNGIKRQLANEIHTEMIIRLMDFTVKNKNLTVDDALKIHYQLGVEMAEQTKEFLSINLESISDLSKIIDFLHDLLLIKGKSVIKRTKNETVSHWTGCSLYKQLLENDNGFYYCHLYQEMYKGVLFGINPSAKANTLEKTRSMNCDYCELKTWIEK